MASLNDDDDGSVSKLDKIHSGSIDLKKCSQKMPNGDAQVSVDEIKGDSEDAQNERVATVDDANNRKENGREKGYGHEFQVGDYVWGKNKSNPWWPGQICDPENASETVIKHNRDGCLLVAFCGDGSWSWCPSSELVPFADNFEEKSKNSSSKNFLKAVHAVVDEVGRVSESKMTCNCISIDKRDSLATRTVSNSAIKAGVKVPDSDFRRLPIPDYNVAEVLAKVNSFSRTHSVSNLLDLAALKGWISAFFFANGGHQLPVYYEFDVDGLEDMDNGTAEVADDFVVPFEITKLGPTYEEQLSPPAVNDVKTEEPMSDRIYHRRKQKSVAELMREDNGVKTKSQMKSLVKERKDSKKSSSLVEVVGHLKEVNHETGSSRRKTANKRRAGATESSDVISEKASKAGNENLRIEVVNVAGKPSEEVLASVENDTGNAKENSDSAFTPRERKRSKYLSFPYISPRFRIGGSSFKLKSESGKISKTDAQNQDDHEGKSSETPSASHQNVTDSLSNEKQLGDDMTEKNTSPEVQDEKMSFATSDVTAPVNEVFSGIQTAAIDPLYLSKEGTVDVVSAFASAFRSSTYIHGENNGSYQKLVSSKKTRSSLTAKRSKTASVRSPRGNKKKRKIGDHTTYEKEAETSVGKNVNCRSRPGDASSSLDKQCQNTATSTLGKPNDDFMTDVQLIRQKFDIMGAILENYHPKFSIEEKHSLKDDLKFLMESVETASDKVRVLAEKHKQVDSSV